MKRSSRILLSLLVLPPVLLSVRASPAAPGLRRPRGDYVMQFNVQRGRGCSRTSVTYNNRGRLRIRFGKSNKVTLTVDVDTRDVVQSKRGYVIVSTRIDRYRLRYRWTGRVRRKAGKWLLNLNKVRARCTEPPAPGSKARPAVLTCGGDYPVIVACTFRAVPVRVPCTGKGCGSGKVAGARRVRALVCAPSFSTGRPWSVAAVRGATPWNMAHINGTLPFGSGAGLEVVQLPTILNGKRHIRMTGKPGRKVSGSR